MKIEETKTVLTAPLKQLQDEHIPLTYQMNQFYDLAEEIEYSSVSAAAPLFNELHNQVIAFTSALKKHSYREEEGLFPLMSRHLGPDDRTIETMEFEHEKAEQHLQDFLTEAGRATESDLDLDKIQSIAVYAVQAHAILTQHFAKEEKMLFPLAESILSPAEKVELQRWLHNTHKLI